MLGLFFLVSAAFSYLFSEWEFKSCIWQNYLLPPPLQTQLSLSVNGSLFVLYTNTYFQGHHICVVHTGCVSEKGYRTLWRDCLSVGFLVLQFPEKRALCKVHSCVLSIKTLSLLQSYSTSLGSNFTMQISCYLSQEAY